MRAVYETASGLAFTPCKAHKAVVKRRLLLNTVYAAAFGAAALIAVGCSNLRTTETATHTLTKTYWKLKAIGDKPVTLYDERREPYMELQDEPARVAGSDGCNRMMGGYLLDGPRIQFTQMAGTMMACENGMEQGAAFTKALSQSATWRIDGVRLQLFDTGGTPLLSFEATARKTP